MRYGWGGTSVSVSLTDEAPPPSGPGSGPGTLALFLPWARDEGPDCGPAGPRTVRPDTVLASRADPAAELGSLPGGTPSGVAGWMCGDPDFRGARRGCLPDCRLGRAGGTSRNSTVLQALRCVSPTDAVVSGACARGWPREFGRVLRRTHDDVRPVPGEGDDRYVARGALLGDAGQAGHVTGQQLLADRAVPILLGCMVRFLLLSAVARPVRR